MFTLVLLTMLSVPGGSSNVSSAVIDQHLSLDDCLRSSQAFQSRSINLPTGQRLTLRLTCESR